MNYLCGIFDHNVKPSRILGAASYNSTTGDAKFYHLYWPKAGLSLIDVYKSLDEIRGLFETPVMVADFKAFATALDLNPSKSYQAFDPCLARHGHIASLKDGKMYLASILAELKKIKPMPWQSILANAQFAYSHLEKVGYYNNHVLSFPQYETVYSGRSKTNKSNLQGTNDEDVVHAADDSHELFLHFDWIAADLRMASIMSGDTILQKSFQHSDPYGFLHQELDDPNITRDDCKKQIFQSLYSLNPEGIEFYPKLSEWMHQEVIKIEENGYGESILGRQFSILGEGRSAKSAFNAKMQGSVAHAMQIVMYLVFKILPNHLMAEIHDSLIMSCTKDQAIGIINLVSKIMLNPFKGYLDSDPSMPLKVSVGTKWRQWKLYKEYR